MMSSFIRCSSLLSLCYVVIACWSPARLPGQTVSCDESRRVTGATCYTQNGMTQGCSGDCSDTTQGTTTDNVASDNVQAASPGDKVLDLPCPCRGTYKVVQLGTSCVAPPPPELN
jgi:hypothetical protein